MSNDGIMPTLLDVSSSLVLYSFQTDTPVRRCRGWPWFEALYVALRSVFKHCLNRAHTVEQLLLSPSCSAKGCSSSGYGLPIGKTNLVSVLLYQIPFKFRDSFRTFVHPSASPDRSLLYW